MHQGLGPLPLPLYRIIVQEKKKEAVIWRRVHVIAAL